MRGGKVTDAVISEDQKYRYSLHRSGVGDEAPAVFIMLNPSTADGNSDDPTIRRCRTFIRDWECGYLRVVNLFAYRSTDFEELKKVEDPVGPANMAFIVSECYQAHVKGGLVICAWGTHGGYRNQAARVCGALEYVGVRLSCLKTTKAGYPSHPLYLPKYLTPRTYRPLSL